jgi:hypothetical protein
MLCVGAGPVDGPSHLTTAEMLAPRATSPGGAAVIMRSRISKIESARLLGERLGIPMPFNVVGKEMARWWAEIGKTLAEQQPEFRARGRPPGSRTKHLVRSTEKDAVRQRQYREKKPKRLDDFVQIGDDTYLLPQEVLASIEPFLIRRDGKSRN